MCCFLDFFNYINQHKTMKLKYKRIILFITMCTMCIGLVTLFISDSSDKSKSEKLKKEQDLPNSTELIPKNSDLSNVESPVPTSADSPALEWETKPEISDLVKKYFDACLSYNTEQLSSLVSNIENINQEKIQSKYALIESYQNIECFITQQPNTNNYLVYVSVDWKLNGIDTLAPSLDSFFVSQKEDGSYCIFNGEIDANTNDFINNMDQSEEVSKLIKSIDLKYQEAITNDTKLQEIFANSDATATPSDSPIPTISATAN